MLHASDIDRIHKLSSLLISLLHSSRCMKLPDPPDQRIKAIWWEAENTSLSIRSSFAAMFAFIVSHTPLVAAYCVRMVRCELCLQQHLNLGPSTNLKGYAQRNALDGVKSSFFPSLFWPLPIDWTIREWPLCENDSLKVRDLAFIFI